jgi:sterol desaturase/sphingolipid hydroxylase (fatty acid hydroxylase superfamily)
MRKFAGVIEHCKISNPKHQITNKSQIPICNDQNKKQVSNFGHCDLFVIWDLLFGIFCHSKLISKGE